MPRFDFPFTVTNPAHLHAYLQDQGYAVEGVHVRDGSLSVFTDADPAPHMKAYVPVESDVEKIRKLRDKAGDLSNKEVSDAVKYLLGGVSA